MSLAALDGKSGRSSLHGSRVPGYGAGFPAA
jgi:hypothetical protein